MNEIRIKIVNKIEKSENKNYTGKINYYGITHE